MRNRLPAFFAVLMFCIGVRCAYAQELTPGTRRILFIGNSITWQGNYVNYIDAYLMTHAPSARIDIINAGLPSETVSGLSEPGHAGGAFPRPDLHERLQRVLSEIKPDVVIASYGINDGIYMPFDSARLKKFQDGIMWLHAEVVRSGARIIHLTPGDYDEKNGGAKGYEEVMDRYTAWMMQLKKNKGWEVVDIHSPMKTYLLAHRAVDKKFGIDGFALSPDGIHPSETGHWIMAREILLHLGFNSVRSYAGIRQCLSAFPKSQEILNLVTNRQVTLRDAWLTKTRYIRPGLPTGLPIEEATVKAEDLHRQIDALIRNNHSTEVAR